MMNAQLRTVLSNISPVQKLQLERSDHCENNRQDGQRVVEQIPNGTLSNIQLRNRSDDPYGLGFVFIACCYVGGMLQIAFSSDWSSAGTGIVVIAIGCLTMM